MKGEEWQADEEDPDFREGDTSEDSAEFSDRFEDEFVSDDDEEEEKEEEEGGGGVDGEAEEEDDDEEEEDDDDEDENEGDLGSQNEFASSLLLDIAGVANGNIEGTVGIEVETSKSAGKEGRQEEILDADAIDPEFEEMVERGSPRVIQHATSIQKIFRGKRARMFARFGEVPPEISYMKKFHDRAREQDEYHDQQQLKSSRSRQNTARNPYKQSSTLNLRRNKAVLSESASARSLVLNHYGVEDQTLKAMARTSSSYSMGKTKRVAQTKRAFINSQSLGSLHLEKEQAVEVIELRDNNIDESGADGKLVFVQLLGGNAELT